MEYSDDVATRPTGIGVMYEVGLSSVIIRV